MRITKRQLRRIIRESLAQEAKEFGGGEDADEKNTMLQDDRWQQWGGWPEGEYKPKVTKQIRDYLKSMGVMKSK